MKICNLLTKKFYDIYDIGPLVVSVTKLFFLITAAKKVCVCP
jgi:hypothetical protein